MFSHFASRIQGDSHSKVKLSTQHSSSLFTSVINNSEFNLSSSTPKQWYIKGASRSQKVMRLLNINILIKKHHESIVQNNVQCKIINEEANGCFFLIYLTDVSVVTKPNSQKARFFFLF